MHNRALSHFGASEMSESSYGITRGLLIPANVQCSLCSEGDGVGAGCSAKGTLVHGPPTSYLPCGTESTLGGHSPGTSKVQSRREWREAGPSVLTRWECSPKLILRDSEVV